MDNNKNHNNIEKVQLSIPPTTASPPFNKQINEQEVETEAINTIEQQIEEVLNGSQIAENDYNDNNNNQNKEQTSRNYVDQINSNDDDNDNNNNNTIKWDANTTSNTTPDNNINNNYYNVPQQITNDNDDVNNDHRIVATAASITIQQQIHNDDDDNSSKSGKKSPTAQYKKQLDNGILNLSHRGIDNSELASINELVILCEADFLVLSHNQLKEISIIAFPKQIKILDLSANKIPTLIGNGFKKLRHLIHLDVSNNLLTTLEGLEYCQSLETINASYNNIQFVDGLTSFHTKLIELDISYNEVEQLENLRSLCLCSTLQTLHIRGNPVSFDRSMRHLILHMLPNVRLLDGNKQAPSPRARSSPEMVDFTIKPVPGSAYRPKHVRIAGGGAMSSGKSTTTYAKLHEINTSNNSSSRSSVKKKKQKKKNQTDDPEDDEIVVVVDPEHDNHYLDTSFAKPRERPWAIKPLKMHVKPKKTPSMMNRFSANAGNNNINISPPMYGGNNSSSINYNNVSNYNPRSNNNSDNNYNKSMKHGNRSPHPVITIPTTMMLPYHDDENIEEEDEEHKVGQQKQQQLLINRNDNNMSPKSLLSHMTIKKQMEREKQKQEQKIILEEEYNRSYAQTRQNSNSKTNSDRDVKQ